MINNKFVTMILAYIITISSLVLWDHYTTPVKPLPPVITHPPVVQPSVLTLPQSLETINQDELKDWLYYLASDELEGRMSGKRGNVTAFKFIEKQCEKYGLKTIRQRFNIKRMNPGPYNETGDSYTENIYAYIEGSDADLKNEIIVVGAHCDHIGYGSSMARDNVIGVHNGADDNASGSVALLAIAKAFSQLGPQPRTIVFQWYSAEEMGLIGSRFYCDNPLFPLNNPNIKNHIFMLNLDMVGRLNSGVFASDFYDGQSSIDVAQYIQELNSDYNFARNITSRGSGGSDHASFYNKRIPIAALHTGQHSDYHRVTDDANKINYRGLELVAKYATELAFKVMNSDVKPTFNHYGFEPMDYLHDHGYRNHDALDHSHPH